MSSSDAGDARTTVVCPGCNDSVLVHDNCLVAVQHVSGGDRAVSVVDASTPGARPEVAVCRRSTELTPAVRRQLAVRTVVGVRTRLQRIWKSVKRVLESVHIDVSTTYAGQIDSGVRRQTLSWLQ